jgi:hypothetical protein
VVVSCKDKKKWAGTHFSSEKVARNLLKPSRSVKTCAMQGSNLLEQRRRSRA